MGKAAMGFSCMTVQLVDETRLIAFVAAPLEKEVLAQAAFHNYAYTFFTTKKVFEDGVPSLVAFDLNDQGYNCVRLETDNIVDVDRATDEDILLYKDFMLANEITMNEVQSNVSSFFSKLLSDPEPQKPQQLHFVFNEKHYKKKTLKKMNYILEHFNSSVLH